MCNLGGVSKTLMSLSLRALKFSLVNKIYIFQCMGKIFCVEFQRYPLKFHTEYLTHTLNTVERYVFYTTLKFSELIRILETPLWFGAGGRCGLSGGRRGGGPVLIGAEVDRKRYFTHSLVSGDTVQEIMTCSHCRKWPPCLLSYQTAKRYANYLVSIKRRLAVGAWQIVPWDL